MFCMLTMFHPTQETYFSKDFDTLKSKKSPKFTLLKQILWTPCIFTIEKGWWI